MENKSLQIITQVARLYHRYGIKSVTMDDVARHLGISKKTLYEHFNDKEDLVKKVVLRGHAVHAGQIAGILDRSLNAIEELFEVYKLLKLMFREYNPSMAYDIRKYYPDLFQAIRDERRKTIYESSLSNLKKGKKEGLYRKDLDARIIAKLHVFRVENLFESDLFSIGELTSFQVFHEFFVYHLHGIMSQKGREFYQENFHRFTDGTR